jgi:small GTP-binding protein
MMNCDSEKPFLRNICLLLSFKLFRSIDSRCSLQANVVATEAGGITQHISAFQVDLQGNGDLITVLDTPGHQAFHAMRQHGATVTDVIILVVAATEGVRPQTKECIRIAEQANVPVVVAINKCDLHDANPSRTREELLQCGLTLETYATASHLHTLFVTFSPGTAV